MQRTLADRIQNAYKRSDTKSLLILRCARKGASKERRFLHQLTSVRRDCLYAELLARGEEA
jgi:hypothetical protein